MQSTRTKMNVGEAEREFEEFGKFCRKALVVEIVLGIALYSCPSHAGETSLGYGKNCGTGLSDGAWQQSGQPSNLDNCQGSAEVKYLGGSDWKRYTVGAAYRKGPNVTNGEWMSDPCYAVRYSPTPNCGMRWYTKSVEQTTKAVRLTFTPTWNFHKDASVFVSYGAELFYSTVVVEWEDKGASAGLGKNYHRHLGMSQFFEVGGTYKNFYLSAYSIPTEHGGESMAVGARGVMAGLRFAI